MQEFTNSLWKLNEANVVSFYEHKRQQKWRAADQTVLTQVILEYPNLFFIWLNPTNVQLCMSH